MNRSRWAALVFVILETSSLAQAEVVRLEVGQGRFGQGWMFLDQDGACKIVTAAHVVRGLNRRLRTVLILDNRHHEWTAGPPLLLSEDPDIAVLSVPAANSPTSCGSGRLSDIGVERRVSQLEGAAITTTDESTIITVPVTRRAASIDGVGGGLFAVRPSLASDQIKKGWSGSVVRDAEGPLGIVYEVNAEHNEAMVVRVDVIRRLMDSAPKQNSSALLSSVFSAPTIVGLLGTTMDPETGPQRCLFGSGSSWIVQPNNSTVALIATFASPIQLHEVSIQNNAQGGQLMGVDVANSGGHCRRGLD